MSTAAKPSITAIVLAFNEEVHIARCLERLWPVVERIVVIDSGSSDGTAQIARGLGAEVLDHAFVNHAAQLQWGIDNAGITTDWIIRIDCDEYLEQGLIDEIVRETPNLPDTVSALDFKLKVIFRGRFIRWGGYYRTLLTRMWRRGRGRMEQRWMDERLLVSGGETVRLRGGDLVDESLKDIGWWTDKHNRYATLQMIDFVMREQGLINSAAPANGAITTRAQWKRFLRNRFYGQAPLYLRALLYFAQRYFLRLGFLDGRQGFVWHFLHGFWYFMLMDAKIDEARTYLAKHGRDSFAHYVRDRYGIELPA